MNIGSWIGTFLAAFGGTAIALAVLVKAASKLGADVLLERLKSASNQTLESFRAELTRQQQLLMTALSFRNTESLAAQERRLMAIEALWIQVLQLRERTGPIFLPYSILVPAEYETALTGRVGAHIPDREEDFMREVLLVGASCEKLRPFLGEKLWVMFWVYRAVVGRLAYRVISAKRRGRPLPVWHQDENGKPEQVVISARYVLSEAEIQAAIDRPFFGVQTLTELLEQKLLLEMERRISGASTADLTVAEGMRLAEALATVRDTTR